MDDRAVILHIATQGDWQRAQGTGVYRCASLEHEGFIHCSTVDQLLIPANERFAGRTDLVLLCIDPAGLTAGLRYEDCYQTGMKFPHVYGVIEVSVVVAVLEFAPRDDGQFDLPLGLPTLSGPVKT